MRLRVTLAAVTVTAGALAVAACSSTGEPSGASSPSTTATAGSTATATTPAVVALSEATKTACAKEIAASKAAAEQWSGDLNELFLASDEAGRDDANKTMHDHLAEWSERLNDVAAKVTEPAVKAAFTEASETIGKYADPNDNSPMGAMGRDVEGLAEKLTAVCG